MTADADVCCWSKCIKEGRERKEGLVRTQDCVCKVLAERSSHGTTLCEGEELAAAQECLANQEQCEASAQETLD